MLFLFKGRLWQLETFQGLLGNDKCVEKRVHRVHINPAKSPFGCLIYLNSYSQINKSCTALRVISLVAVACQYCWCTVNWVNIVRNPFSPDSFRVNLSTEASQLYKEREREGKNHRAIRKEEKEILRQQHRSGGPQLLYNSTFLIVVVDITSFIILSMLGESSKINIF